MKKTRGVRNIMTVFRLAQRLMRGCRGRLYFLLTVLSLFQVEASLMMPLILKNGFQAVADGDMQALLGTAAGGAGVFGFNFVVMYFLNVYGDAWVTKFAFHAAGNCLRELSGMPLASVQAVYRDDDLFNRIAAGTGNIMGFYFSMANLAGSGAAVLVLTGMLYRLSNIPGGFLFLYVVAELAAVRLRYRCNAGYTSRLQKDKEESIRRVRCLLEQLSFHQHNQTWEWMRGRYGAAREKWLRTQEKKTLTASLLDSCLISMHGFFKTGLVYGFMVKQEIFSSYAEDIASSFSAFNNLADKTKGLGGTVSGLPNSLVPIGKLDEVLAERRQGGDTSGILSGNVRRDGQLGAVLPGKVRRNGKSGADLSGNARQDGRDSADSLVLEHISVTIGDKEILRDICCRIPLGSKVAVIGENGSGKSTLLKAMAGLYRFQNGYAYGFERRTAYIPAEELLFQGHSVWENISYSREHISAETIKRQLGELRFHDVEEVCGKVPAQLSGGEAKRVNITRGLPGEAEVILADEPDSCLDQETAGCVMRMLLALKDRTVIYITHNPEHARLADMVIFIQDGEIRQVMEGEYERNAYFCRWSNAGKQCQQDALDG